MNVDEKAQLNSCKKDQITDSRKTIAVVVKVMVRGHLGPAHETPTILARAAKPETLLRRTHTWRWVMGKLAFSPPRTARIHVFLRFRGVCLNEDGQRRQCRPWDPPAPRGFVDDCSSKKAAWGTACSRTTCGRDDWPLQCCLLWDEILRGDLPNPSGISSGRKVA